MAAIHFTRDTFSQQVLNGKGTALVDFWGTYCGPCQVQGPIIDELAEEMENKGVIIGKINVEEERGLALEMRVMSIPTLMVFRDGKEVRRAVGLRSKEELLELLQ